jgi:hypothetical protein
LLRTLKKTNKKLQSKALRRSSAGNTVMLSGKTGQKPAGFSVACGAGR